MRKKPMLAYPVSDKPIDYTKPVFMQPKLDGVRCLIQYERRTQPREDVVVAYSRTGKQWLNINHILQSLVPFFQANPNVILDGELYNHALRDDFEKIISLVRKQKPTDTDRRDAQHLVQFHVYDYFDGVRYDSYDTRRDQLICSNIYDAQIKYVHADPVHSYEAARDFHAAYLSEGYEGSIIRLDGLYKPGRSYDLMKFKDFSDTEATIIGYEIGKGKRTGTLGMFIMLDD